MLDTFNTVTVTIQGNGLQNDGLGLVLPADLMEAMRTDHLNKPLTPDEYWAMVSQPVEYCVELEDL